MRSAFSSHDQLRRDNWLITCTTSTVRSSSRAIWRWSKLGSCLSSNAYNLFSNVCSARQLHLLLWKEFFRKVDSWCGLTVPNRVTQCLKLLFISSVISQWNNRIRGICWKLIRELMLLTLRALHSHWNSTKGRMLVLSCLTQYRESTTTAPCNQRIAF